MEYITLKQLIKTVLFIALSITIGRVIVLMPGFSVGLWIRNLAPAAIFGVLLILLQIEALPIKWSDWVSILKLPDKREFSVKLLLILIPLAAVTGLALIRYDYGLTLTMCFLLAGAGILISVILIVSDKQAGGLSLLIITLPIVHFLEFEFSVFYSAYHGIFYTMPSIFILWIMAFVFIIMQLLMRRSFVSTPFNKVWLIMFIPMLLSAAFSSDSIEGFRHVLYFFSVSMTFFLATNMIISVEGLKLCTISLAIAAGVRVLTLIYFEMGKMSVGFEYGAKKYESLPSFAAILGGGVCFCLFSSLGLASSIRSKLKRGLIVCGIVLFSIIMLLKLPRSISISLTFGVIVLLLNAKMRKWVLCASIILILLTVSFWDTIREHTALGRFEAFSSVDSFRTNQNLRIDAYQAVFSMIKDYPVFGICLGRWDDYYYQYMKHPTIWTVSGIQEIEYVSGSHNIFLQYGATCGIPGLISIVILAYAMIKNTILLYCSQRVGLIKDLSIVFTAITVSFWTSATLGGASFELSRTPEEHYWFWLFVGLIAAARNLSNQEKS